MSTLETPDPIVNDESGSGEEDDDEDEDDEEENEAEPVETLVAGRERRQKAANRYSQLLALAQQEEAEEDGQDDLTLLFHEEGEEDIEFEDPDAIEPASDADDDSSSDEEDKGPAAGEDDFEGERQLEKEERAKQRANKRKADKAFAQPPILRKKVKIAEPDPATIQSSTPLSEKPRKKSERVSWLPAEADAPIRTSKRTLAVQNKERTLASMKESESKRVRQIAVMEAANRRKEVTKAKPMTQAERMAEAARTERMNSKSLNKWEEMEKDRIEKQKARLEALQNRKLEGPVIRWYSGRGEWEDDQLVHVGKKSKIEDVEETRPEQEEPDEPTDEVLRISSRRDTRKQKDEVEAMQNATTKQIDEVEVVQNTTTKQIDEVEAMQNATTKGPAVIDMATASDIPQTNTLLRSPTEVQAPENDSEQPSFLDDLEYYASLPDNATPAIAAPPPNGLPEMSTSVPTPLNDEDIAMHNNSGEVTAEPTIEASIPSVDHATTSANNSLTTDIPHTASPAVPAGAGTTAEPSLSVPPTASTPSKLPRTYETATRNLITFLNYDPTAIRDKDIQRRILFAWPSPASLPSATTTTRKYTRASGPAQSAYNVIKPVQPVCAITAQPAKYRDPKTGLPYSGMEAFKAIRSLVGEGNKGAVWSSLLEAWVGPAERVDGELSMRAAKGVPAGFLRPAEKEVGARDVKAEGRA